MKKIIINYLENNNFDGLVIIGFIAIIAIINFL